MSKPEINKDYVVQSLLNQIVNKTAEVAERDAVIRTQAEELEAIKGGKSNDKK